MKGKKMSESITPGRGGGALVPVVAGAGVAVLPSTGANWAIPVASILAGILLVWGIVYLAKTTRKAN